MASTLQLPRVGSRSLKLSLRTFLLVGLLILVCAAAAAALFGAYRAGKQAADAEAKNMIVARARDVADRSVAFLDSIRTEADGASHIVEEGALFAPLPDNIARYFFER